MPSKDNNNAQIRYIMATKKIATPALLKAVEKLNAEIEAFRVETSPETDSVELYEDAYTTRNVRPDFKLYLNGKMTWTEDGRTEDYEHFDEDDVRDTLKYWRACLRRARKYWAMNVDTLDAIQNGEREDIADDEE